MRLVLNVNLVLGLMLLLLLLLLLLWKRLVARHFSASCRKDFSNGMCCLGQSFCEKTRESRTSCSTRAEKEMVPDHG